MDDNEVAVGALDKWVLRGKRLHSWAQYLHWYYIFSLCSCATVFERYVNFLFAEINFCDIWKHWRGSRASVASTWPWDYIMNRRQHNGHFTAIHRLLNMNLEIKSATEPHHKVIKSFPPPFPCPLGGLPELDSAWTLRRLLI